MFGETGELGQAMREKKDPPQCRLKRWRILVGSEDTFYDLTSFGSSAISAMRGGGVDVDDKREGSGESLLSGRGLFIHTAFLGSERFAVVAMNFNGAEEGATAKCLLCPPLVEHKKFFEMIVNRLEIKRLWFVDIDACKWFESDPFYADFAKMFQCVSGDSNGWRAPLTDPRGTLRKTAVPPKVAVANRADATSDKAPAVEASKNDLTFVWVGLVLAIIVISTIVMVRC